MGVICRGSSVALPEKVQRLKKCWLESCAHTHTCGITVHMGSRQ